jgi:ribosomal protein L31
MDRTDREGQTQEADKNTRVSLHCKYSNKLKSTSRYKTDSIHVTIHGVHHPVATGMYPPQHINTMLSTIMFYFDNE